MIKFLDNIQRYFFVWIIGVMFAGLSGVYFFGGFKFSPIICFVAALIMIYPSFVPLSFDKLTSSFGEYQIIIASVVINFVVFPFLAYYIGEIFLASEPVLRLGLVILALLPGGGMVTTWAMRSKADMPTTVSIIIINLLLAIIITPFGISFFVSHFDVQSPQSTEAMCVVEKVTRGLGSCDFGGSDISPMQMVIPMLVIVFVPLVFAYLTQKIIISKKGETYFNDVKKIYGKFSNFGLLVILFFLMMLRDNEIVFSNSAMIMDVILPLILFYGLGSGIILLLYKTFDDKSKGKSFIWGSYVRYITLALGIAISIVFQDENLAPIIIVISMAYFVQVPLSFLLAQYLKRD